MRWSEISTGVFDRVVASESTQVVPYEYWPPFAVTQMPNVVTMWAWRTPEDDRTISSRGDTFENVEGIFDLIRKSGSSHYEWKVYRYVVKQDDGRTFLSGPIKDIDYGHHTSHLPPWPLRPPPSAGPSE